MKKAALLLALLGAAGAAAFVFQPWTRLGERASDTSGIPRARAVEGRFERWVRTVGYVQAGNSAAVYTPFSGKILRMAPEGSRVNEGEPVVWLETTEISKFRDETSASLGLALKDLESAREEYRLTEIRNKFEREQAKTQVELSEQNLSNARQKYDAEKVLVDKGISPKDRLEETYLAMVQAELNLRNTRIDQYKAGENADSNLRIAQTGIDRRMVEVENYQKLLAEAEEKLASAAVKAPTTGEVSVLSTWKGSSWGKVQEGDSVWERLQVMEIPDMSEALVVAPVHESQIAAIEPGQRAIVRVEAFPQWEVEGEVLKKSVVPTQGGQRRRGGGDETGPREFDVTIKLKEVKPGYRHGMTAAARVLVTEVDRAVLVPIEAVTKRDGKEGVVLGDGTFVAASPRGTNETHAALDPGVLRDGAEVFLRDPATELGEGVGTGTRPDSPAGAR